VGNSCHRRCFSIQQTGSVVPHRRSCSVLLADMAPDPRLSSMLVHGQLRLVACLGDADECNRLSSSAIAFSSVIAAGSCDQLLKSGGESCLAHDRVSISVIFCHSGFGWGKPIILLACQRGGTLDCPKERVPLSITRRAGPYPQRSTGRITRHETCRQTVAIDGRKRGFRSPAHSNLLGRGSTAEVPNGDKLNGAVGRHGSRAGGCNRDRHQVMSTASSTMCSDHDQKKNCSHSCASLRHQKPPRSARQRHIL
jgi:hypothetical protein